MSLHRILGIAAVVSALTALSGLHAEILPDDLATTPWKITPVDDPRTADPATDDGSWSQIELADSGQMRTASPHVWLRRSVSLDPTAGAYAFYASRVNGSLQVFLNGVPARPVLQVRDGAAVFALSGATPGPNVLAIRIDGRPGLPSAMGQGSVRLMDLQSARKAAFQESLAQNTLALLYGALALLLVLRYGRTHLSAAVLYGALALVGLLSSPLLRSLLPSAADAVLLYTSLGLAAVLPALLMHTVSEHFDLALSPWMVRLPIPLSAAVGAASVVLHLVPLERAASILLAVWYGLTLPFWAVLLFRIVRQTAGQLRPSSLAVLGMLLYLLFAEGTLLPGGEFLYSRLSVLGFAFAPGLLVPALLVAARSLRSARPARRETAASEPDWLFSLLLDHATRALEGPMRLLNEARRPSNGDAARKADRAPSTTVLLSRIDGIMDDVLQLCHLEMQSPEEAASSAPAHPIIEAALQGTGPSRTLRIADDILTRVPSEHLATALGRLVSFPGFNSFDRRDLIGTTDEEGQTHLRLLMHHDNRAELRRIYDILTEALPDNEALWVKWRVIEESIRLFQGDLRVRSLSGRYLAIDVTVPCLPAAAKKAQGGTIPLVLLHDADYLPPPPPQNWQGQLHRWLDSAQKRLRAGRR